MSSACDVGGAKEGLENEPASDVGEAKKGWGMNCDIGGAMEGLKNEL